MTESSLSLREQARAIWQAAVAAANPFALVFKALREPPVELRLALGGPGRILVVGGGKAGAPMTAGLEAALASELDRVAGVVNVPEGSSRPLQRVRLHPARSAGSNHPTEAGVAGTSQMLELFANAGAEDVGLCLLSGGGSALMPAPVDGVSLEDKQQVTRLLHACGATIDEMNCVRKHLSRVKGGRLAQAFTGSALFSLIISDVIGDPLDVIASGPTAVDPTTFVDALAVLDRFDLRSQVPAAVLAYLEHGRAGMGAETPKLLPATVHNLILGNNARALAAAATKARELGWPVLNLGSFLEGETRELAIAVAGIIRSILNDGTPVRPPVCLLSGGETTVSLNGAHGKGGRNQEFVLAALCKLEDITSTNVVILSGGTDGEDGPTDAAGAVADCGTLKRARELGVAPQDALRGHDSYSFFQTVGGLLQTGLTETNVMDVRVILIAAG